MGAKYFACEKIGAYSTFYIQYAHTDLCASPGFVFYTPSLSTFISLAMPHEFFNIKLKGFSTCFCY